MSDAEEPRYNTLAERIAALNKQKAFNPTPAPASATQSTKRRPPPPPPPPVRSTEGGDISPSISVNGSMQAIVPCRSARTNVPPPLPRRETQSSITSNGSTTTERKIPPPLPSRTNSASRDQAAAPPLPRRTSSQSTTYLTVRRNSASSEISQHSNLSTSSLGRIASSNTSYTSSGSVPRVRSMAPATWEPDSLPALPPSKRITKAKAKEEAAHQSPNRDARAQEVKAQQAASLAEGRASRTRDASPAPDPRPSLPPRLPSRPAKSSRPSSQPTTSSVQSGDTKPAAQRLGLGSIRGFSSGLAVRPPSITSQRPQTPSRSSTEGNPPPVPLSSRPSTAQIESALISKAAQHEDRHASARDTGECWVCRDWTDPDRVASQFPRESLPRDDPVGHLARGLCDPFPSYDDKARAIFSWCHHNIAYDTVSFFNRNVRHHTVDDTIFSGLAVCQGYAETYKAIAIRAGLECVVVSGHGKGFGHQPLKKGQRPPTAKPDGHAWNAVRVDGGFWKLIDPCWGAGHLGSDNLYHKEFAPLHFTLPNEKFGLRHFPKVPQHQFRSDERTVSWEEYFTGGLDDEPVQLKGTVDGEGIAEDSLEPRAKEIAVDSGQVVRFQFCKPCEHWTSEKVGLGKPALFLLNIRGIGKQEKDTVPLETNGYWHWLDVNARDLGDRGETVQLLRLDTVNGQNARGVTAADYLSRIKGRQGMSWSIIAMWNLA